MPPLVRIPPSMIPEATKRRLEQAYHPVQTSSDNLTHNQESGSDGVQNPLSARPSRSPIPNSDLNYQERRNLPNRSVTDERLDDAYVDFIMYCNPTVPLDTDTSELRKIFRAPPKSDGKTFNTFTLFELIRKLEQKEIKTWAQLAIDLGVEPPLLEKGQSAQKVQQYAVRLKRWMHAMHVDAFFEYLLNKVHIYWTQVPSTNEPASDSGRDGVSAEEDLALRALLPETRPKRGRRKAEDRDNDDETGTPSRRPRLDSPTLSEDFMIARASLVPENSTPASGQPGFHQSFDDRIVPWSATDVRDSLPDNFRWAHPDDAQTPMSAYPRSAITPSSNRTNLWNDGSRSAITPNKPRSRRRHGPAVSSAWPSNGSAASGKLRGRPPSNRSVTDGAFSTFPANPGSRDVPSINLRDNTPSATPIVSSSDTPQFFPPEMSINPPNPPDPPVQNGRPSRLQLQVPERQGGAVRLATPPPVVLLNGEGETSMQNDPINQPLHFTPMMEYFNTPSTGDPDSTFNHFVSVAFRQNEIADRTNVDALESHFISEIIGADWYDDRGASIDRCSLDEADKICKQVIKNLQAESSSPQTFLINLSALAGGPLMTRLRMTRLESGMKTDYECQWKMKFGSIEADFTIRATVQRNVTPASKSIGHGHEDTEASWKQRYLALQQQIRERDEKVGKLKRGVLDALVVSNHYTSA